MQMAMAGVCTGVGMKIRMVMRHGDSPYSQAPVA
jgi:hypothetical protein